MKLRNKKTGEIWNLDKVITNDYPSYDTLKSINDDFEDYKEPLIKDSKIFKAVRAWAEANDLEPDYEVKYDSHIFKLQSCQASIEFNSPITGLEHNKIYTVIELC